MLNFAVGTAHSSESGQIREMRGEAWEKRGLVLVLMLDDSLLHKGIGFVN